jgi:hypothetical protein
MTARVLYYELSQRNSPWDFSLNIPWYQIGPTNFVKGNMTDQLYNIEYSTLLTCLNKQEIHFYLYSNTPNFRKEDFV